MPNHTIDTIIMGTCIVIILGGATLTIAAAIASFVGVLGM